VRLPISLPPVESRAFDVVGFGQNSVDLVAVIRDHPQPDTHVRIEQLKRFSGGEVATAIVACARLGCRTRYLGAIGNDEAGGIVKSGLTNEGVDCSHVRVADAPNRFAIILVDRDGRRTVVWYRDPKLEALAGMVDVEAAASGRVLLLDASNPDASASAAAAAQAAGSPVVLDVDAFDVRVEHLLQSVDVVIASRACLVGYAGPGGVGGALRRLVSEFHPALAVVTLGAEGSLALCEGTEIRTPAFNVPVVDSTGAGDAFRGGFVASWLRFGGDADVGKLLQYASGVAALNCGALGAQTGLPKWAEVDVLVTQQGYDRSK
jgi:sugar/nucleoside kinase (ribokinase family)